VELLRTWVGLREGDTDLMLFESALAEIGSNSLVHGLAEGSVKPLVEYNLRVEDGTAFASFTDHGPPLHNLLTQAMPAPTSEAGRGLAIARKVLDRLAYERDGEVNTWRLVKRL
jgi:serine/threonine-protein kinase RsbW